MEKSVVYLVKVDPNANNSKYYKMIPNGDKFVAEYGRLGNSNFQSAMYNMSQWDKKYNEKIKKGYENKSELIEELVTDITEEITDSPYQPIPNKVIATIVDRLQKMANDTINKNYQVSANQVTNAMIESAQGIIDSLASFSTSVENFNNALIELFKVLPRKMKTVKENLAKNTEEIPQIYQREQDLLDVMKGQVVQRQVSERPKTSKEDTKEKNKTILETMGIEMYEITEQEKAEIKQALGSISDRFYQAWKVKNIKTQKNFDKYMSTVKNKETKLLFHGSRSENWWSIINSGLVLRPNAQITGKMFGYGIYFAPQAQKSLGYTSIRNSYWAGGNSDSGFMGLYEVHYGNPYIVDDFNSKYYEYSYEKLITNGNYNCLHADSSKGMLRNDEIIVYKECQCTIKYLVELK